MPAVEINRERRGGAVAARVPLPDAVDESEKKPERYEAARREDREGHGTRVYALDRDVSPYGESPRADDLADCGDQGEGKREADAAPEAVGERIDDAVLRGERLGAAEDDAVHDDEGDEDAERGREVGQIGLHEEVDRRDESRYDDDVAGNVHRRRDDPPQGRHEAVGADEHERRREPHAESVLKARRDGKRGAQAEHKPKDGIVLENPIPKG